MEKFSVLMSIYNKEKKENLIQSIESILINQTKKPDEIIIVKDGKLTKELDDVINRFSFEFPEKFKILQLEENVGLGKALNKGLALCSYNLVARMDSDDISSEYRFEKQLDIFSRNPEFDIVGGNIAEFFVNKSEIKSIRVVPQYHDEILKRMKFRNPMNHVSVMFKKDKVIEAGGYKHMIFYEDYYLWARMSRYNCKYYNIQEEIVYVRTGEEMFKRRGDKKCILGGIGLHRELFKLGIINCFQLVRNIISIIIFTYMPSNIKGNIYKFILRK